MARDRVVRGQRVEQAIRKQDRPFATCNDIAEALGVVEQTVLNNRDNLEAYDGLEMGKVGQATVFWLSEYDSDEDVGDLRAKRWTEAEIIDIVDRRIKELRGNGGY